MGRGPRWILGIGLLAAAAVFWFGLGMHRGLLLSGDIQSRCWPWAPFLPQTPISAPALSDPVWQFVPWLEFARRELSAGTIPLWNPHQNGGGPLLGNGQSALGSPLVWPVLLFGAAGGWNLSLLLRLLLAFGGVYFWLRDCGRSGAAAVLGAVAFALSGPLVAWLEHPQALTACAVPAVLLFTGRLVRGPTRRDLVGLALATYLVMSGGHPETQLMAAILGAAVLAHSVRSRRSAVTSMGGAVAGASLAAPLLLPFAEYFGLSEARVGVDRHPFVLPLSDLARFVVPRAGGSNVIEAAATVSILVLALAACELFRARADRRVRFWSLVALVVLLVTYENPLSQALTRHTLIYWTRALLFLPLALGYLASGQLDALRARIQAAGWRKAAGALGPLAILLTAGELLFAAQGVHGRMRPADLKLTTPLLERLEQDPEIFRILPLHTFLPPESATGYGLDDVRGYDALTPRGWRAQLESIGRVTRAPTQVSVVEPWDLVAGGSALDFWNVKYLLLHPQFAFGAAELGAKKALDLETIYSGTDGRILRNRRVRPRVRLSGPGEVVVVSRSSRRWSLRVEAPEAGELTVANPMFPGWTARVDGRPVPLAIPPGGAIRVGVPAGKHRVELAYLPWSFRFGCLVAIGAAIVLGFWARTLPRGVPPRGVSVSA